jgi:predicted NAD-dependent protein-ADP-ribosyltransferase YbiA (DUF1768 family)
MIVRFKDRLLIITAETDEERQSVGEFASHRNGRAFALFHQDSRTLRLSDLGPIPDACREPINISSRSPDPAIQLISNFAHTPFDFDGQSYASVEAFWQGLKFPEESRRRQIAALHGQEARQAGFEAQEAGTIEYQGQIVRVGTHDHWRLMSAACWAKFNQHEMAKRALLGTGDRPLQHKTRRDSRTIPGVIMAEIWMKVRRSLNRQLDIDQNDDADVENNE